jgi:diguanylate cyclase (GGDEF)-like protein/PAS domain S-box-containing protein
MSEDILFKTFKSSNNHFYEMLINNLNDAVHLMDQNLQILLVNPASKDLSGYSQSKLIGNPCQKNILIPTGEQQLNLCYKDCPVKKTLKTGNIQHLKAYIRHKEGYFVPVMIKVIPIKEKDGKIIGAVEIFAETSPKVSLPQSSRDLERMQLLDPLTKLGNKQYVEMFINSRLHDKKKYNLPFGVLLIDIDNMYSIIENYGSVVGDKMLKMISQTLVNNIRFFEMVGRWSNEKFVVILINVNATKLDLIANKLRLLVEQSNIRHYDKLLKTTISIGATLAHSTDSAKTIINRIKKLADQSKKTGKNRVSISA